MRVVILLLSLMFLMCISASSTKILYANKVAVLLYHDFSKTENSLSISPDHFEEHLKMLKEHSFNVISMEHFIDFMLFKKSVPPNAVVITFDDGYEDFYTLGYPILKKYSMVASNFVIVSATDVQNPDVIPHLTWDEMRTMKRDGMSFYSHTYNLHHFLDKNNSMPAVVGLKQGETLKQHLNSIHYDFLKAQQRLDEELGTQNKIISFPYGAYNKLILKNGEELGINLFFTTQEGMNVPGSKEIRRINAGSSDMSADRLLQLVKNLS